MALFKVDKTQAYKKYEKYTQKVEKPQYLPSSNKPSIESLCNRKAVLEYMVKINDAMLSNKITTEEAQFLKYASQRFLEFNYALIADYYAHSNAYMQELMEDLALVIVDFDDAIAKGFVELSGTLKELREYDEQTVKE